MSDKRLSFEEFVDMVKESIKDYLPERFADADITVEQFQKLNTHYLGLQVKRADQTVVPNINLNARYQEYLEGGLNMARAMRTIADQVQAAPDLPTKWLSDYSQVKSHLFVRVSDAKENEAFLAMAPHKEVDGLAISYHIAFEGLHGVEASTPVSHKMMEMYGVTVDQLHADALENSQRLYPVRFSSLMEVMQKMLGLDPDIAAEMMPPMEGPQVMVLTNMQSVYGASALFYPGQLDAIAQQMGSDFFVLPSSVHETLILPDDGSANPDELQFMVQEINRTEVAPEDRLSDFVYHYDAQEHILERAETFAARMAQKEQEADRSSDREADKATGSREEKTVSREGEKDEAGDRKERKSVLGRLNEKKEQVKSQPKKSGPNRAQEASI
ncbi:MAG: hypothetical protein IKF16_04795 [Lachnospiraceae bacterium]|nr:hypothetical protein [Lachnospiraceae bacterium]